MTWVPVTPGPCVLGISGPRAPRHPGSRICSAPHGAVGEARETLVTLWCPHTPQGAGDPVASGWLMGKPRHGAVQGLVSRGPQTQPALQRHRWQAWGSHRRNGNFREQTKPCPPVRVTGAELQVRSRVEGGAPGHSPARCLPHPPGDRQGRCHRTVREAGVLPASAGTTEAWPSTARPRAQRPTGGGVCVCMRGAALTTLPRAVSGAGQPLGVLGGGPGPHLVLEGALWPRRRPGVQWLTGS